MLILEHFRQSLSSRWTGIYLKFLASVLGYGATVHVGSKLGLGGRAWSEIPFHYRLMDVVLLVFNVVTGVGLWNKKPWAALAFVAGLVLFQIVPYTVFREHFIQSAEDAATLNGLIGTELILLAILGVLIFSGKQRAP